MNLTGPLTAGAAGDWVPAVPNALFNGLNPKPVRGSDLMVLRFLSPDSAQVNGFTNGASGVIRVAASEWNALIRDTPTQGAEAALAALAHTPPEQVPALVAFLARIAASATSIPRPLLPNEVPGLTRRAKPSDPIRLTEAQRREAHRRYRSGDRSPGVVLGEREYQRLSKRARTIRARTEAVA